MVLNPCIRLKDYISSHLTLERLEKTISFKIDTAFCLCTET